MWTLPCASRHYLYQTLLQRQLSRSPRKRNVFSNSLDRKRLIKCATIKILHYSSLNRLSMVRPNLFLPIKTPARTSFCPPQHQLLRYKSLSHIQKAQDLKNMIRSLPLWTKSSNFRTLMNSEVKTFANYSNQLPNSKLIIPKIVILVTSVKFRIQKLSKCSVNYEQVKLLSFKRETILYLEGHNIFYFILFS